MFIWKQMSASNRVNDQGVRLWSSYGDAPKSTMLPAGALHKLTKARNISDWRKGVARTDIRKYIATTHTCSRFHNRRPSPIKPHVKACPMFRSACPTDLPPAAAISTAAAAAIPPTTALPASFNHTCPGPASGKISTRAYNQPLFRSPHIIEWWAMCTDR